MRSSARPVSNATACAVSVAALMISATAFAQDVVLTKDYGLNQFRPAVGLYTNKTIDARSAQFTVANSKNAHPTWSSDCNSGSLPVNIYPLNLDRHDDFVFKGGRINSKVPQGSEWSPTYCNSSALIVLDSDRAVIDGVRIMGAWDGVRFARNSNDFTLKNAWLSDVRDDCVENDQQRSGRIVDVLFDGCFVGISTAAGAGANQGNQQYNHTVVVERVLMRMKAYPYRKNSGDPLQNSHGHIFKSDSWSPSFEILDSVFAYEADPFQSDSRLTTILDRTTRCENNYVLWLSDKPLPSFFSRFPSTCFEIIKGQAARDKWDSARGNWIDCHPENVRGSNDETSVASRCGSSDDGNTLAAPEVPTGLMIE